MTIEELTTVIDSIQWFENLTKPIEENGLVQIGNLNPWANIPTGDDRLEQIADDMEWLPSSRDQDDPVHGELLEEQSEKLGKKQEHSKATLAMYKSALSSLRKFQGHDALKAGPHNFTEAARGAALYAARRAAHEVLLADEGFWCKVVGYYAEGHWPCGILHSGEVVIL